MASVFPKPPSLKKDNARQKALSIKLRHSLVWRQYYTNSDDDLSLTCTREFLFYYRDKSKREIDLVFLPNDELYPIEIKENVRMNINTKTFKVLESYSKKVNKALIITNIERIMPLNEDALFIPVSMIGYK